MPNCNQLATKSHQCAFPLQFFSNAMHSEVMVNYESHFINHFPSLPALQFIFREIGLPREILHRPTSLSGSSFCDGPMRLPLILHHPASLGGSSFCGGRIRLSLSLTLRLLSSRSGFFRIIARKGILFIILGSACMAMSLVYWERGVENQ